MGLLYIARFQAPLLRNCDCEIGALHGADDAARHPAELRCERPRGRAQRAGIPPGDVAKDAAESAEALPSGIECNVGDGQISVPK
jgi:hypothetical protein